MNVQQYRATIAQLVPINSLSQKHFDILLSKAELVELPKNRALFRKGDVDKSHFYLLEGELSIDGGNGNKEVVSAGSEEACQPLAQHQPRQHTATATTPSICLKIESKSLDMMLAWDNASNYTVDEITPASELDPSDWMGNLLKNPVFHKIPPRNLQTLFLKLEQVNHHKGETIISQGAEGDHCYVVARGGVDIIHTSRTCLEGMLLATLKPGDLFGADALISNTPRSASAVMRTDGALMRLSKSDFRELVAAPIIREIQYDDAAKLVEAGRAVLLDVRLQVEYNVSNLRNSVNLPLVFLRLKYDLLDPDKLYIAYCDTGGRSAAAAFLLQSFGLDACVLKGGLQRVQEKTEASQMEELSLA